MVQVERHFHKGNEEIVRLCKTSKDLYNRCNYLMRKAWFEHYYPLPDINLLVQETQELECFKELHNTKTAKQTIRKVLSDWSNFRKAINSFKRDPMGFLSKPKPPQYKDKLAQVVFYSETIKRKPLKDGVIIPTNKCFEIRSDREFQQVVITPKTFGFVIEVQYDRGDKKRGIKLDKNKACTVDVGLNTLCAITLDQKRPILVNGRILKSINQWYNKRPSKSRSKKRYFRIENYFHHVSKIIVAMCVSNGAGTIIIGKNNGWKQSISLDKKTNQSFCFIPFYLLLQKIKYKAEQGGIEVIFTEESYTSKASFFDGDPLPEYSKIPPVFSGKRKYRGLYVTGGGFAVNADVNGSLNIGRKVIPEFLGIGDRSLAARPVAINPLKYLTVKVG